MSSYEIIRGETPEALSQAVANYILANPTALPAGGVLFVGSFYLQSVYTP